LQRRFDGQRVILGIDRLDYVKGIPHKLLALEKFLTDHPEWIGKVVLVQVTLLPLAFIRNLTIYLRVCALSATLWTPAFTNYRGAQVAVPSRTNVADYQRLQNQVHKLVGRIQGKFGTLMDVPIHYIDQSIGQVELTAIYNIADVLMVTSLRDGMNLVSFEYVACQERNHGVLILSEMAGAAQGTTFDPLIAFHNSCLTRFLPTTVGLGAGAMLVNPYNTNEISQALHDALNMGRAEREQRHQYMHQYITKYTSQYWAENFVSDLRSDSSEVFAEQFESITGATNEVSKPLTPATVEEIQAKYHSAGRRLIVLGLLGNLMTYEAFEQGLGPSQEVLELLGKLVADPRNTVVIVSGRERAMMNEWLG